MKNILLIAYSYPPLQDAQSIRWYYLSNVIAKKDFQIDVVTIKVPNGFSKEKRFVFNNNINIIRTFPGIIEWTAYRSKAHLGTDLAGNVIKRKKTNFKFLKTTYWLIRNISSKLLLGDLRIEWVPFVYRKLKRKLNFSRYDLMITSQEPFVSSIIGLFIKRYQPDLKWIADLGDPLSVPYYSKYWRNIHLRTERAILNNADRIIVTGMRPKEHLLRLHPNINPDKINIIRQGFDISSYDNTKRDRERLCDQFSILYTGTFYKDFRDPSILIDALSELKIDFRLTIVGRNEMFLNDFKKLGNKVIFKGFMSHFDVIKLQKKADVLLHLCNKQGIQIPGKVYEYLGSTTPIFCVTYNEADESALLIKRLHAGIVCMNRKEEIKSNFLKLYELWLEGKLRDTFKVALDDIRNFSWTEGEEKLESIIKELLS